MRERNLLFYLSFVIVFAMSAAQITAQTLTHSYVFENGAAVDEVGGADGTLMGDATAIDGQLTLSGTGYVNLPAGDINIASYGALTIEAVFTQTADLAVNTILFGFGQVVDGWMGVDYFMFQPTVGYSDQYSAVAIETGNYEDPWFTENSIQGSMVTDTFEHYVAVTLTSTEMFYYLDGGLVGSVTLDDENAISGIGIDTAFIGASVYTNDAKWEGSISEFKIYNAAMSAAQVEARATELFGDIISDASLESITYDVGDLVQDSETDYTLYVPYGVTSVNLDFITTVPQADVLVMDSYSFDTLSMDEPVEFTSDGIDLTVVVTAMDGSTATYYFYIYFDEESSSAELSDITLSVGNLIGDFDSKTTEYTAMVPYGTQSVEVNGVPGWSLATVTGGGTIAISDGTAEVELVVTSQDEENTKTYTVTLNESKLGVGYYYYIQQEVSELVMGESGNEYNQIKLYNPILNDDAQLFQIVESGVDGQYFLQNKNGKYLSNSASYYWDLLMGDELKEDQDSSRFIINEFEPGRFQILSVARVNAGSSYVYLATDATSSGSSVYGDKYSDNANSIWSFEFPEDVVDPYDTYLASLEISEGFVYPRSFDAFTYDYYVTVPVGVTSISISATANDATTSVTGTGSVSLSADTGTVVITVTATDASYSTEYYVHYQKDVALTLMHSYTFADGTANDVVGDAHGTLVGGSIVNGAYLANEQDQYIELPSEDIAINTYPSFTFEAYIQDDTETVNESTATMLAAFGDTQDGWLGVDYFFLSTKSRAAITCGDYYTSYDDEEGVDGAALDDDEAYHYVVGVVTNDSVSLYLDGYYVGSDSIMDDNIIRNLSNAQAYLGKSLYPGDDTWLGYIHEFNIYAGAMDAQTVSENAGVFPIEDATSLATLSEVTIADTTYTAFESTTTSYTFILPEGTTEVPEITGVASNSNATVVVDKAESIPGVTTITVTSEDKEHTVVYSFEFAGVTAVSATEMAQVKVYPTVSSGSFTIESESASQKVSVYDLSGSLVMQQVTASSRQEISLEKAGMYILMVEADNARSIFKVIKTN